MTDDVRREAERLVEQHLVDDTWIHRKDAVDVAVKMVEAERERCANRLVQLADGRGIKGHDARHPNGQKTRRMSTAALKHKSVEMALRQAAKDIRQPPTYVCCGAREGGPHGHDCKAPPTEPPGIKLRLRYDPEAEPPREVVNYGWDMNKKREARCSTCGKGLATNMACPDCQKATP